MVLVTLHTRATHVGKTSAPTRSKLQTEVIPNANRGDCHTFVFASNTAHVWRQQGVLMHPRSPPVTAKLVHMYIFARYYVLLSDILRTQVALTCHGNVAYILSTHLCFSEINISAKTHNLGAWIVQFDRSRWTLFRKIGATNDMWNWRWLCS